MAHPASVHPLGRLDRVTLVDMPALSKDVPFDRFQSAWPEFERSLDSLCGRKMMGLVFDDLDMYRLCSVRLARDAHNSLGLDEAIIPGGDYLRLRMQASLLSCTARSRRP